ncbi:MAG: CHAT domain-containing protein [Candidatus Rokubacteria bacterium]|nr:CHAT domain-containing protein [Candidatus Rokubacteria bacterium]
MSASRAALATALAVALLAAALPPSASAQRPGGGAQGGGGFGRRTGPGAEAGMRVPDSVEIDGQRYPYVPAQVIEVVEQGPAHARKALAAYERAAAEADARGALVDAFLANGAAAMIAVRLGMPQKAITAGTRALDRPPPPPRPHLVVQSMLSTYSLLGRAYRNAGDLARARTIYEQGLAVARGLEGNVRNLNLALIGSGLAEVALAQRDEKGALAAAAEAVEAAERGTAAMTAGGTERMRSNFRRMAARSLIVTARTHTSAGRYDDAEAALGRARQYARLTGLTEMDGEVLSAHALLKQQRGDHAAAVTLFQEALAGARRLDRVTAIMTLSQGLARSYVALNRPEEALDAAKVAIKLAEEVRSELSDTGLRTGYLDEKQGLYQLAARLALRLRRPGEAFGYAEASRARAFLDLLGNQTALSKGRTGALVDEELRLRARLAEAAALSGEADDGDPARARAAREAAERDYRAFIDRVRKESVEQASLMSVEPVTLTEIQALLPADTTLLEYMVGTDNALVWIVERTSVQALVLPVDRATLVAEVRGFRDAISALAPLEQVRDRGAVLYQRLLAALRPQIRGSRLLVVPHDVLHYLPFAALRGPDGRWLVEDLAVSTLPSASVLKFLAGKGAGASHRTLAVGNPDVGTALNLPWAEREARLIGQRLPATTVLVRGEATEARAKQLLGQAGLVHFATHGELNETDPLASALLLTPGGGDDGRLEVRELFTLELQARLVVLSACETGLGTLSRGDELVGLQRAFLYAGTPAVMTTLWKVDDRASFDLIRAFYDTLGADGAVQALRHAQLVTMGAHPHPFSWAAFGLSGAPR